MTKDGPADVISNVIHFQLTKDLVQSLWFKVGDFFFFFVTPADIGSVFNRQTEPALQEAICTCN